MKNLNEVIIATDILQSIGKAIKNLPKHWKNEELISGTEEAVQAISSIFEKNGVNLIYTNELMLAIKQKDKKQLRTTYKKWVDTIHCTIIDLLTETFQSDEEITIELIGKSLQYLTNDTKSTEKKFSLILELSHKYGKLFPSEAFNATISTFDKVPDFLSTNELHPGYVYDSNHKQYEFKQCPICQGVGTSFYSAFSYRHEHFSAPYLPQKLWMKCEECENIYSRFHPLEYVEQSIHYEIVMPELSENKQEPEISFDVRYIWSDILSEIAHYNSGKRILGVGVGKCELLTVALDLEYEAEVIEEVKSEAQVASNLLGIPIVNCDFLQFKTEEKFPIIMMEDYIEYAINPTEVLEKAYDLLEDDGVLWLSTPEYGRNSSMYDKFDFDDPVWEEMGQISHFSFDTLVKFLKQVGFSVEENSVSARNEGSMELILKKHEG